MYKRQVGDKRLARALTTIIQCRDSGEWPGKHTESEASPPRWALIEAGIDPDEAFGVTITAMPELDND